MGDYNRLYQLFSILLDNALRYADPGTEVTVSPSLLDTGQLEISVHDYGKIIPPKALPHIFERFYRADTDDFLGSGLGLAVAAALADRHDIKIDASSSAEKGTTFTLVLASPLSEN
ncbi:MAG: ATP-binding protein [Eubacteriales bacterium]|nr:ATP-binding protein [Eubacteriales bacterium]